jgi:hypothetical protein
MRGVAPTRETGSGRGRGKFLRRRLVFRRAKKKNPDPTSSSVAASGASGAWDMSASWTASICVTSRSAFFPL